MADLYDLAGRYGAPMYGRRCTLTVTGGINTWEKQENISEVWEKSAAADSAGKEMLPHMRQQYFVDANILQTRVFCRRQHFVAVSILSTPTFCGGKNFFGANIFSAPIFCHCQYFVAAKILLPPIFCPRQYFVAANILSAPIFCLCLGFKDDYLLNLLLMIVFVYIMIIFNLSKPFRFRLLVSSFLLITASITIKVAYNHTRIVYTGVGVGECKGNCACGHWFLKGQEC